MSSSCPNINFKSDPNQEKTDWELLIDAVGSEFNAYKDYFEHGGNIRTPAEVRNDSTTEPIIEVEEKTKGVVNLDRVPGMFTVQDLAYEELGSEEDMIEALVDDSNNAAEVVLQLESKLGVKSEFISEEDAKSITAEANNSYNGEPAFYFGDTVYFVIGKGLNLETAFHEFSHPFVRAISVDNPVLFNRLYQDLISTPEGMRIKEDVASSKNMSSDNNIFKEEVLVRGLTEQALKDYNNIKPTKGFINFIKNIFYAIKQLFRKKYGKNIKISKLDSNTTIKDLSKMLVGAESINLPTDSISRKDVVAYMKEREDFFEEISKVSRSEAVKLVTKMFDLSNKQVKGLLKRKEFDKLSEVLTDDLGTGPIQKIRGNLQEFQARVEIAVDKHLDESKIDEKRLKALVKSILTLEIVMGKINTHVKELSTEPDSIAKMNQVNHYTEMLEPWEDFIEQINETLDEADVNANSPIVKSVNNINRTLNRINSVIDDVYAEGARETLYEQLEPIGRTLKNKYEGILERLRSKKAPPWKIDKVSKEYYGLTEEENKKMKSLQERNKKGGLSRSEKVNLVSLELESAKGLAITREKVDLLLKGQAGDANFYNSFFEGYLYSADPIIGGLALYVKNETNQVLATAQKKFNNFSNDIEPLLKAAGFNPRRIGELGEKVGFIDIVAVKDEDGKLVKKQVWTFINPHKDWRYDFDILKNAVEEAVINHNDYHTDDTRKALIAATGELNDFKRKYMHDEFTLEYYERQELFEKDDIGIEAAYQRKTITEKINSIVESKDLSEDLDKEEKLKMLWREYSQLSSIYYANGEMKTDIPEEGIYDLSIAKRIKDYNNLTKGMYDTKLREGVFETSLELYETSLFDRGISPDNPVTADTYQFLRDAWIENNTDTVILQDYYKQRDVILNNISAIMSKLYKEGSEEELELSIGKKWEQIFDLVKGYKNDSGQPQGSEISKESLKKIKTFQEEIEAIKAGKKGISGLTKIENEKYNKYRSLINKIGYSTFKLNRPEEFDEYESLDALRKGGLNKNDIEILKNLYSQLAELMDSKVSDDYINTFNNFLVGFNEEVITALTELLGENTTITKSNINLIIDDDVYVDYLRDESPEFKEWFDNNHIKKTFFEKNPDGGKAIKVTKFKPTYAWTVSKPSDNKYYETYEFTNSKGEKEIVSKPSNEYHIKILKSKYRTPRVIGDTIDNRGQWLPRNEKDLDPDNMKYINEKYQKIKNNEPLFNLLEKLKEHHLENQEGLNYRSRLYLDMPRYRKSNLEVWQSTSAKGRAKKRANALTIWAQRVKDFFQGAKDDTESGWNYKDEFNLIRADMFDNEQTAVPISGLYDIDINDVSTDITTSMMRYMLSGERQKALVKASPAAKAIQRVITKSGEIKDPLKVNKETWINKAVLKFLPKNKKNEKSVRQKAVDNFIDREFKGETLTGAGSNSRFLMKFSNTLFGKASFGFFALNIPSALKNSYGAKFQGMIEASAGKYYNHAEFQKGNAWSYTTMAELSFSNQLYKKGSKSLRQQIVEIFDPSQDRFGDKFGEGLSRTMLKDAADITWLFSFRKWVELQATLQIFGGMMHRQKVTQVLSDGTKKSLDYIDAWEKNSEGQIKLKEGVDIRWSNIATDHLYKDGESFQDIAKIYNIPEDQVDEVFRRYSIDNIKDKISKIESDRDEKLSKINLNKIEDSKERESQEIKIENIKSYHDTLIDEARTITIKNTEFNYSKNRMQQVMNNLQGTYAKFDQPEAQRYLAFRFLSYLRRYFTSMATNRFGFSGKIYDPRPRLNPGMGDVQMGYYIQFLKSAGETITKLGRNLPFMEQEEKAAAMKVITEMGMLIALPLVMSLLLGWDPDDEDRFAKLRNKSGALPFIFSADDPNREFNLSGWFENHALLLLMNIRAENEQFVPLPGYGLSSLTSMIDLKSIVFTPTIKSYKQIIENSADIAMGGSKSYYKRTVGPYDWQQEGSNKIISMLAKMAGFTGSAIDPAKGIKGITTAVDLSKAR
jgi:hypothetical protein